MAAFEHDSSLELLVLMTIWQLRVLFHTYVEDTSEVALVLGIAGFLVQQPMFSFFIPFGVHVIDVPASLFLKLVPLFCKRFPWCKIVGPLFVDSLASFLVTGRATQVE